MRSALRAAYDRLGRPPRRRLAAVLGAGAAVVLLAVAAFGDTRLIAASSLLMSLATLAAVAAVWNEARRARFETRASNERTEVTYRRILAAIEVERLAAERRHAQGLVPSQERTP